MPSNAILNENTENWTILQVIDIFLRMQNIEDFSEIQNISEKEGMSLFYLSRPACGVCTALKPKVSGMLKEFPEVPSYYVNLDDIPEAAGQLSIFTIPAILVYAGGKEVVREARYISIEDLAVKIRRPYGFLFDEY